MPVNGSTRNVHLCSYAYCIEGSLLRLRAHDPEPFQGYASTTQVALDHVATGPGPGHSKVLSTGMYIL
jgi:hypothetical protein